MPTQTAQQAQNSFAGAGLSTAQEGQVLAGQSSGVPAYTAPSSITSDSLKPSTAINVPPPPTPATPATGATSATMASNNAALNPATDTHASDFTSMFEKYLGAETPPPSTASTYESVYGVTPQTAQAQQATAQADLNTKNKAVQDAQSKYNALQAQINGLDYQGNVVIPNQDQQNAAGRGETVGGLAPITAAQQRAILLQKAPLQLQALTAQADLASAQGNATLAAGILKQANDHLDAIFNAQVQDAQNQYKYQSDLRTQVYNFATTSEQRILDAQQHAADQAFTAQQNALKSAQDLAKTAISNGQSDIAAKIMALDPKSPTYQQDVAQLSSGIIDTSSALDTQLKKAQIAKIYADINTLGNGAGQGDITSPVVQGWVSAIKQGNAKLSDITAAELKTNPTLKNDVIRALGAAGNSTTDMLNTTAQSLAELNAMVQNNKGFSAAVGVKGITATGILGSVGQFFGYEGQPIPGSQAATFDAKLKQVKNDVILPNLTLLHGLGRVTDREFQALTSAVTSLSPDTSESAFKDELANLTDMINKKVAEQQQVSTPQSTSNAQVLPPEQIPAGYYQASDGLLYKKQ